LDILNATIDDFPLRYERHILGVPGPISDFLRVACAIVCYHVHHYAQSLVSGLDFFIFDNVSACLENKGHGDACL